MPPLSANPKRTLIIASTITFVLCATTSCAGWLRRAPVNEPLPGDMCAARLPEATAQLETLAEALRDTPSASQLEQEIALPGQPTFRASAHRIRGEEIDGLGLRTGLSDVVISCKGKCDVTAELDGEPAPRLDESNIALRCLPANTHQLVIKQSGATLFDGIVDLASDHALTFELVVPKPDDEDPESATPRIERRSMTPLVERLPKLAPDARVMREGESLAIATAEAHINRAGHTSERLANARTPSSVATSRARWTIDRALSSGEVELAKIPPTGPVPMSKAEFKRFLAQIKEQRYEKDRLSVLRVAAKENNFTSAQAAKLIDTFKYGEDQVDAAIALHPQLTDPGNFFQVIGALRYSKDKEKVRKKLGI